MVKRPKTPTARQAAPGPALKGAAARAEARRQQERRQIAEQNKVPFETGKADAPFGHSGRLYRHQMRDYLIACIPMALTQTLLWGKQPLLNMALCVAVAMAAEYLGTLALRRPNRLSDLHSAVIGLLFALVMPLQTPWWMLAAGAAAAVIFGKILFSSDERPILNPALVGWLLIALLWPVYLQATQSPPGESYPDPVRLLREGGTAAISGIDLSMYFAGKQLGGLGAVNVRDIMLGGLFILYRRNINWRIMFMYFIGGIVTALVFNLYDPALYAGPGFHVYAGAFFFGALFLACDFCAAPVRLGPALLYGFATGSLVVLLRIYAPFPDAVPPAILIANALAYALNRIRQISRQTTPGAASA